jgi:hypothetical protein
MNSLLVSNRRPRRGQHIHLGKARQGCYRESRGARFRQGAAAAAVDAASAAKLSSETAPGWSSNGVGAETRAWGRAVEKWPMTATAQATEKPNATSLSRSAPILAWMPLYRTVWLAGDAVAGLTLCGLAVPEAMAYAGIAGLPPQCRCLEEAGSRSAAPGHSRLWRRGAPTSRAVRPAGRDGGRD